MTDFEITAQVSVFLHDLTQFARLLVRAREYARVDHFSDTFMSFEEGGVSNC